LEATARGTVAPIFTFLYVGPLMPGGGGELTVMDWYAILARGIVRSPMDAP